LKFFCNAKTNQTPADCQNFLNFGTLVTFIKKLRKTEPMNYLIETNRLGLRELTPGDARHFYDLNADPEVVKYTGDPPFKSLEAARNFLENYDQYQQYGYGRWAVILKETGEFIGWCGLKYLPELDETDLGFRFFRKHWNRGFASEAARACVDFGFKKLKLKRIVGRAMAANAASVKVLEKTGFVFEKEMEFEEHPGLYFSLDAPPD
jgi:[ribosomal protein S5]-alanine N-acetyltransferase